jgi:Fe-S-cluster containining protein
MSDQLRDGLRYLYKIVVQQQAEIERLSREVTALTDALVGSGSLSTGKLNTVRDQVAKQPLPGKRTIHLPLVSPAPDKFKVEEAALPCAEAAPICRTACCHMEFQLSPQDVEEGIVRWDVTRPFRIAQKPSGECSHLEQGRCSVHANRPTVCRAYDCRGDVRVWRNFEMRIPSEQLCGPGDHDEYQRGYMALFEELEDGLRRVHKQWPSEPAEARAAAGALLARRDAWHRTHPYPRGLGLPFQHGDFADEPGRPSVNFGMRRAAEPTLVRQLRAMEQGAVVEAG